MIDFFRVKDFESLEGPHDACERANKKLNEAKVLKVSGFRRLGDNKLLFCESPQPYDTHLAYVFDIKEIEPCKSHDPERPQPGENLIDWFLNPKCKHCGIKIKTSWNPSE